MAFNINAHVILSGPKNIKAVTKQIQKQLGSVKSTIRLDVPKNLTKSISGFNKGLSTLTKNITTLKTTASAANAQLTNLTKHFQSLNSASSSLAKSQAAVQSSLGKTGKQVHQVRGEIEAFGKDAALAVRRFAAFTLATGVIFGFVRAVQTATKAALDYEREIVKVVQVTGAGAAKIAQLKSTIDDLSKSLGVDANELAELARIFSQTGQTIDEVRDSIRAIARSSLAPSFGEMKNTAEGLIAAMAQFNIASSRSEEVLAGLNAVSKKFAVEAEDMISVIRRAGGVFSTAAGDMTDPVKSLNELIGIFTAVRSTTRESADTIAVGLRTIFTRIQRRSTIDFLKQFNVELIDVRGNFIGLFPAFQELSRGLSDIIKSGDALTLSAITEELGGVRQVGKLIPAITQFNKALAATKIAGEAAAEGLGKDVGLALQPLGKQFELLQARFAALIRTISESQTFQNLAKLALSLGNAFITMADALTPLIPLLTTFAAVKISGAMMQFGAGFVGGLRKGGGTGGAGGALGSVVTGGGGGGGGNSALIAALNSSATAQKGLTTAIQGLSTAAVQPLRLAVIGLKTGLETNSAKITSSITNVVGSIGSLINALNRLAASQMRIPSTTRPPGKKFARGGAVHGPSHSQGGVPAVLEGGEYVIPKGYAAGGISSRFGAIGLTPMDDAEILKGKVMAGTGQRGEDSIYSALRRKKGGESIFKASRNRSDTRIKAADPVNAIKSAIGGSSVSTNLVGQTFNRPDLEKEIGDEVEDFFRQTIKGTAQELGKVAKAQVSGSVTQRILDSVGTRSSVGSIFEGSLSLLGAPFDKKISKEQDAFDFPMGLGPSLGRHFEGFADMPVEAKKQLTADLMKDIANRKATSFISDEVYGSSQWQRLLTSLQGPVARKAAGGNIFSPRGTDTVPAMLTPGEFVINKTSAKKAGYGNLSRINKMNRGGVVSSGRTQYFKGGTSGSGSGGDAMGMVFGIQMAVGALTGFATALASFDTDNLKASFAALGYAAMNAVGAMVMMNPALGGMLMQTTAVSKVTGIFSGEIARSKKMVTDLGGQFRKAKGEFRLQRTAVAGGPKVAYGGSLAHTVEKPAQSVSKSLMSGSKAFFSGFKGNFFKIVKGAFTGLPGLLASLIVGPLVGVIAKSISKSKFGEMQTIKGTNIQGRVKGVGATRTTATTGGAAQAAALDAAGAATTLGVAIGGLVALLSGPLGIAVGAAIIGFKLLTAAAEGAAKQAEFIAFKELQSSVSATVDALSEFDKALADSANLNETTKATKTFNQSLDKTSQDMSRQFQSSFIREGGKMGVETIGSRDFGYQQIETGRRDLSAPGWFSGGGQQAAMTAFKKSSSEVTPELLDKVGGSFNNLMGSMTEDIGRLSPDTVALLAGADSMKAFSEAMQGAAPALEAGGAASKEFNKEFGALLGHTVEFQMVDQINKEIDTMDKEAAANLIDAFDRIKGTIDFGDTPEKNAQGFAKFKASIEGMEDTSDRSKNTLIEMVGVTEKKTLSDINNTAAIKMMTDAANKSKASIDALTSGLKQFGARVSTIADQADSFAVDAQREFAQITGKRTVGQIGASSRLNPFKNISGSTDTQIDKSINELQGMGSAEMAPAAFRGLGDFVKASRDFPGNMKAVAEKLRTDQKRTGETPTNKRVVEAIGHQLGTLPPQLMEGIKEKLGELSASGKGKGGKAFNIDSIEDALTKGDIFALLGPAANVTAEELSRAHEALTKFKNAVLKVAELEAQMMQRRLDNDLGIMDKENSIRDRVNKALGRTPDALTQVTGDLRKRLELVAAGGTGKDVSNVNVFNPHAMLNRLMDLRSQIATKNVATGVTRRSLGSAAPGSDEARELHKALGDNSSELAILIQEFNGTKQALQELSTETKTLAAIESQIADANSRETGALSSISTLSDLMAGVATGKITQKQAAEELKPFRALQKGLAGEELNFEEGNAILQAINGGNKLVVSELKDRARTVAGQGQFAGMDAGQVEQEFIRNLNRQQAQQGQRLAGQFGAQDVAGRLGRDVATMDEAERARQQGAVDIQADGDLQTRTRHFLAGDELSGQFQELDRTRLGLGVNPGGWYTDSSRNQLGASVGQLAGMRGGAPLPAGGGGRGRDPAAPPGAGPGVPPRRGGGPGGAAGGNIAQVGEDAGTAIAGHMTRAMNSIIDSEGWKTVGERIGNSAMGILMGTKLELFVTMGTVEVVLSDRGAFKKMEDGLLTTLETKLPDLIRDVIQGKDGKTTGGSEDSTMRNTGDVSGRLKGAQNGNGG